MFVTRVLLSLTCLGTFSSVCAADFASEWLDLFRFAPPVSCDAGVCEGTVGALPSFTVTPPSAGVRLVRVSLAFAPGALPKDMGFRVCAGSFDAVPDFRPLMFYPGKPVSVRRGIVTFPYPFPDTAPCRFTVSLSDARGLETAVDASNGGIRFALGENTVEVASDSVTILSSGGGKWVASLVVPPRGATAAPLPEIIENGAHYVWVRLLTPDSDWPRIVEVRADALGTVTVCASVQRRGHGDDVAPDLGWDLLSPTLAEFGPCSFAADSDCRVATADGGVTVSFPEGTHVLRGGVTVERSGDASLVHYLRCRASENVPFQECAWRRMAFSIAPSEQPPVNALLEPAGTVAQEAAQFDAAYRMGLSSDLSVYPELEELLAFHRNGIAAAMREGDDFGNVTAFNGNGPAAVFGMNRLNHCPAIFADYWRTGDARLRDTALLWCENMYDLSLWWGHGKTGGTRYNNINAQGKPEHLDDKEFMWRSNDSVHFCTKGIDSFLLAFEETGDPAMAAALRAQIAYSVENVHTDQGECRNIGDVTDFMDLYRLTGERRFLDEALRLFRELRTKLMPDGLFSQGGQPIVAEGPFINDDQHGYEAPFAKPYIIGYALAGLPALLRVCPDEPRLAEVVHAVAQFMAAAQDPVGGWRYPHPSSAWMILDQSVEHAAQMVRAAEVLEERGEDIGPLVDAVERVLQARLHGYLRSGMILGGLQGWEFNAGNMPEGKTIYDLYTKPSDRDRTRDYSEGAPSVGGACPEGMVYLPEVLAFYLKHRPAERLYAMTAELRQVLERVPVTRQAAAKPVPADPMRFGLVDEVPTFRDAQVARMTFSLAWEHATEPFAQWRVKAREAYIETLLPAPPSAPFDAVVLATEDRGSYEARKVALNLNADSRVIGYLLVPKAAGRHPAMLALHDHGAHFSIGKEKVIRPFGESEERVKDAQKWVETCYGGRYIGDVLAERGYVVFSTDALYWGDRGRKEGPQYEAQQALASNVIQLGYSWAGMIVHDDIRSAAFLQCQPEVDPERIACMGLSMGAHRTWSLAAATDIVKAGLAICWMGDTAALTAPGNNQTRGYSSYSMNHPGLRNLLDYPDVASLACPKPMLFYNGDKDGLFPVDGVERSYAKMRAVWESQGAGDALETRLWPVPHEFNVEMQEAAFAWLEARMTKR